MSKEIIRQIIKEEINKIFGKMAEGIENVKDIINRSKLPREIKDEALMLVQSGTEMRNGKVFDLKIHPDLLKKIKEKSIPNGFSMGIDKNGFFIYTHRARCHSYERTDKIPIKVIKFINSTG